MLNLEVQGCSDAEDKCIVDVSCRVVIKNTVANGDNLIVMCLAGKREPVLGDRLHYYVFGHRNSEADLYHAVMQGAVCFIGGRKTADIVIPE